MDFLEVVGAFIMKEENDKFLEKRNQFFQHQQKDPHYEKEN